MSSYAMPGIEVTPVKNPSANAAWDLDIAIICLSLTSTEILVANGRLGALHCFLGALGLEFAANIARAARVHGTLKGIPLPAKDVVTVLRISLSVPCFSVLVRSLRCPSETHPSPVLQTNGCPPSAGHRLLSLNCRVWSKTG